MFPLYHQQRLDTDFYHFFYFTFQGDFVTPISFLICFVLPIGPLQNLVTFLDNT